MTRIGITGHSDLTNETALLVAAAIRSALRERGTTNVTGVSCMTRGADRIFAAVVRSNRCRLEVILPTADFRKAEVIAEELSGFDGLLAVATKVTTMPYTRYNLISYIAAIKEMLSTVDELWAVWDGKRFAWRGTTAVVVRAAHKRGIPVTVIWPNGAQRRG